MNNGYIAAKAKLDVASKSKQNRAMLRYYSLPKVCLFCEEVIPYERRWSKSKFCNHSCSAKYTNKKRARKPNVCLVCSEPNLRLHYFDSVYCSGKCQRQKEYTDYIDQWLKGIVTGGGGSHDEYVSTHIRRYLLSLRDNKCEKCSWCQKHPITGKIPLTIHHIDGNPQNHKLDNLEILCPNCHSLTPTYGSLNVGNGRRARRKR